MTAIVGSDDRRSLRTSLRPIGDIITNYFSLRGLEPMLGLGRCDPACDSSLGLS